MSFADFLLPLVNDWALADSHSYRHKLLGQASGTVLELGFGSGLNAHHYGAGVDRVIAVEPDDAMWQKGRQRAHEAGLEVERIDAFGESLPLADVSVDMAVSTFVLCSVRHPSQVLAELARVVVPGGLLLTIEHVANPSPVLSHMQRVVTPVWKRCLGGCHPGRDLVEALRQSPWQERRVEFERLAGLPRLVHYHLLGVYENTG